ncbi:type II toxin-antitoxin system RelE/ParE family toxin [Pseudomonas rhodesiae]|uniref:type II toxin-antitoxin system RelE/ParE family toxin n=1 Tax=Pseudomonas rhodesiae TaxID=76760 RepID=UPI00209F260D|nr:type II toxin-antitoxin system RelE/ParE family toxin [Pseudomonas rhodesiae]
MALENPTAAGDFSDSVFKSIDKLAQFPSMGRKGQVKRTREWAVPMGLSDPISGEQHGIPSPTPTIHP